MSQEFVVLFFGVALLLLVAAGAALTVFLRGRRGPESARQEDFVKKLELLEYALQKTSELQQQFNSALRQDISENLRAGREASDQTSRNLREQVRDFTESVARMQSQMREVHQTVQQSTERMNAFQNIFKTPKLRGQWGEANLEYLLSQTFAPEQFRRQHYFKDGEAVDFALCLPNDLLLPIDAKFPMETYVAYAEEEQEALRNQHMQAFARRVKAEVDAIAAKYIRPEEGTTDLALMFVPAEAVYYDILFHLRALEIGEYAQKRRVILTSPNTLFLTLAAVQHWFRDVTLNKQTQEIRKRLGTIFIDGKKLQESFERLGKHISHTRGAYEDSEKRLALLTGRVERVITSGESEEAVAVSGTVKDQESEK